MSVPDGPQRAPVFHWFLPTSGDGRGVGDGARTGVVADGHRAPNVAYLAQIAQAAEQLGFVGVLTPTGTWCEEAWLTSCALAQRTTKLRFLVAFRPGMLTPTLAAQMASTFQHLSGDRLAINVVTGGEEDEQHRFGDWLPYGERYERTDEFLQVLAGALGGSPYSFEGAHYRVAGATVRSPAGPPPTVYFGGASAAAERVAARHADVYLCWGEPPAMLAERVERVRALAEREQRVVRFGVRLHVITRERSEAAWEVAERLLAAMDPAAVAQAQARLAESSSVGQRRMLALHGGGRDGLEVAPNLWAGIGLVRGGAGTALVGSHEDVGERIEEYRQIGFDEFIFSGYPHLEEAYWFGEGVLPRFANEAAIA